MYTIEIDLDHIEDGLKGLKAYGKRLDEAMDDALIELYVKTDDKLISEIGRYGLSESELAKYKFVDIEDDYFEIGLNAPYAEFVEFGTGIPKSQYDKVIGMLVSDDDESTKANVQNFVDIFNSTKVEIETKVKSEYSSIPVPKSGTSESVTKEAFNKMGYADKLKFKATNPELYTQFMK